MPPSSHPLSLLVTRSAGGAVGLERIAWQSGRSIRGHSGLRCICAAVTIATSALPSRSAVGRRVPSVVPLVLVGEGLGLALRNFKLRPERRRLRHRLHR